MDSARRQDHAAACLDDAGCLAGAADNADGSLSIKQDAQNLCAGEHADIGALLGWPQIGIRRGHAPAIAGGELEVPGAFLGAAVEIPRARHAVRLARGDEGFDQFVTAADT